MNGYEFEKQFAVKLQMFRAIVVVDNVASQ